MYAGNDPARRSVWTYTDAYSSANRDGYRASQAAAIEVDYQGFAVERFCRLLPETNLDWYGDPDAFAPPKLDHGYFPWVFLAEGPHRQAYTPKSVALKL